MTCPHTFAKLLSRTLYAKAASKIVEAQHAATDRMIKAHQSAMQQQRAGLAKVAAIHDPTSGIPLVSPVQEVPTESLVEKLRPVASDHDPPSALYDAIKFMSRQFGLYELDHATVYSALESCLGPHVLPEHASPADALALATAFAFCSSFLLAAEALPHAVARDARIAEIVTHAAHFANVSTMTGAAGQDLALDPVRREYMQFFVRVLLCHGAPSAVVTDIALSLFASAILPLEGVVRALPASLPLQHFVPFVNAMAGVEAGNAPKLALAVDCAIVSPDNFVCDLVGFSRDGLVLAPRSTSSAEKNAAPPEHEVVHFALPFVLTKAAARARPSALCAGCALQSTPLTPQDDGGSISLSCNGLVAADLSTAADLIATPDGSASFSAEAHAWDAAHGRAIRTGRRTFVADLFDLHTLVGVSGHTCSALQALGAHDQQPLLHGVQCEGISVGSLLTRADDYRVDSAGGVVAVSIAGKELVAKKKSGKLIWATDGQPNFSFTFDDVVG